MTRVNTCNPGPGSLTESTSGSGMIIMASPPKTSMPQINIFASSNHIHHYTYSKNPYVHIQVFHILHHHTMKLLQAFKSFLIGESIIENQQSKPVCCWPHNSTAETVSLQALQFRQRMLLRCSQHTFSNKC